MVVEPQSVARMLRISSGFFKSGAPVSRVKRRSYDSSAGNQRKVRAVQRVGSRRERSPARAPAAHTRESFASHYNAPMVGSRRSPLRHVRRRRLGSGLAVCAPRLAPPRALTNANAFCTCAPARGAAAESPALASHRPRYEWASGIRLLKRPAWRTATVLAAKKKRRPRGPAARIYERDTRDQEGTRSAGRSPPSPFGPLVTSNSTRWPSPSSEAGRLDRGVVDEHLRAVVRNDETESFVLLNHFTFPAACESTSLGVRA